ncbi:MAG: DNA translocase FtsK, partial [Anaerolineales bacterium]|nr:DNA translocase FtsK [Anaerolineales bacterium]
EHTLESFGAPATVVEISHGPTVTQFGVEPNFIEARSGKRTKVKVGKIASLADDLALALAAHSIRIQAPVPGKGYVGIEVPNVAKALVSLRDVIEAPEFRKIKSPLAIGLGQNVSGQPISADLAAMPHLLIAGTTGSGKSVCVNGIIACLLLQNTPDNLKLVMVDPKRVELTGYNGVPHLAAPVVVEMDRVIGTLQWALREMDGRYKRFAEYGARNIVEYNKKIAKDSKQEPLPYIVIIIDELADLMMLAPEDTERAVTRLAQMARATGIHMVIATQRPSVDVVTGIIKANFPARIAFAVASSTDSRVILDTTGAERLLGQGDMLFQSPDAAAPVRLQGCYVSDGELNKLIEYWRTARRFNLIPSTESITPRAAAEAAAATPETAAPARPTPPPPAAATPTGNGETAVTPTPQAAEPVEPHPITLTPHHPITPSSPAASNLTQRPLWEELQAMENAEDDPELDDELLPEAIALVRKLNKASTSLLQRRFRIGYTRAARLVDHMEEQGIIGPPTGTSKARVVLPPKLDEAPDPGAEAPGGEDADTAT